jgi:hypothetical protein
VRRNRRPTVKGGSPTGECGESAWHRPRLLACVMSLRFTVATALATDRGVFGASACACDQGTMGMTWRAGGCDVACERALWRQTDSSSPFQIDFSPKFQATANKTLNTKVSQQLTFYQSYKSSRVV